MSDFCAALGHDWGTFSDGEKCPLCGQEKPKEALK